LDWPTRFKPIMLCISLPLIACGAPDRNQFATNSMKKSMSLTLEDSEK
jgi:hypothetical protein